MKRRRFQLYESLYNLRTLYYSCFQLIFNINKQCVKNCLKRVFIRALIRIIHAIIYTLCIYNIRTLYLYFYTPRALPTFPPRSHHSTLTKSFNSSSKSILVSCYLITLLSFFVLTQWSFSLYVVEQRERKDVRFSTERLHTLRRDHRQRPACHQKRARMRMLFSQLTTFLLWDWFENCFVSSMQICKMLVDVQMHDNCVGDLIRILSFLPTFLLEFMSFYN